MNTEFEVKRTFIIHMAAPYPVTTDSGRTMPVKGFATRVVLTVQGFVDNDSGTETMGEWIEYPDITVFGFEATSKGKIDKRSREGALVRTCRKWRKATVLNALECEGRGELARIVKEDY